MLRRSFCQTCRVAFCVACRERAPTSDHHHADQLTIGNKSKAIGPVVFSSNCPSVTPKPMLTSGCLPKLPLPTPSSRTDCQVSLR